MPEISPALREDMRAKLIDSELTLSILADYNSGLYDGVEGVRATGVPRIDGRDTLSLDCAKGAVLEIDGREARERLGVLGLELPASVGEGARGRLCFGRTSLEEIGRRLLGRTAFGVLNGGSATSY